MSTRPGPPVPGSPATFRIWLSSRLRYLLTVSRWTPRRREISRIETPARRSSRMFATTLCDNEVAIWKIVEALRRCKDLNFGFCATASDHFQIRLLFSLREKRRRIATCRVIHRGFQVPFEVCCNSAIASRSETATLVRGEASLESSEKQYFLFFNATEEHLMTDDGHQVAR